MNEFAQLVSMPVICVWGVIIFWGLMLLAALCSLLFPHKAGVHRREDASNSCSNNAPSTGPYHPEPADGWNWDRENVYTSQEMGEMPNLYEVHKNR